MITCRMKMMMLVLQLYTKIINKIKLNNIRNLLKLKFYINLPLFKEFMIEKEISCKILGYKNIQIFQIFKALLLWNPYNNLHNH